MSPEGLLDCDNVLGMGLTNVDSNGLSPVPFSVIKKATPTPTAGEVIDLGKGHAGNVLLSGHVKLPSKHSFIPMMVPL